MYVLDTNVISELRKKASGRAAAAVIRWADAAAPETRYICSITVMELEMGVLSLENRDRAQAILLREWLLDQVIPSFTGRILPVDQAAATACARMMHPRTRPLRDALIAATAQTNNYVLVTRNVKDFQDLPVRLANPWEN
jgi:predicted nucleic acid-binding protein